jgi:hypothetical protein
MRSAWRRVGAVTFSLLVPLVGCSEDDVTFPSVDAADEGALDSRVDTPNNQPDVSVDKGVDTGIDAGVDVTIDPRVDATPDADGGRGDADVNTIDNCVCTDIVPDSDALGADTADGPTADEGVVDADGAADAVSEEAGTCESLCASGVCDTNGDCKPCVKDDECTAGKVCNAGTCGPRCGDGGVICTGNLVCCSEHCIDATRDPQHCGACGTTCSANQFCGNASTPACKDTLLRNLCNTKKATFLLDGLSDDDASSNVMKNAIVSLCVPAPMVASVSQSTSTAINNTTGQPLVGGGDMLVAAGGDSTQLLVKYLETSRTSPVYNETDGVTQLQWKRRGGAADGGDAVIVTVDLTTITPTSDYFLAEVVKDPISGTFSLIVYGVESPGTRAGAFYFGNVILPNIVGADVTTITQAWYIYKWTSANPADAGPSLGDTYLLVDSGQ